MLSPKDPRTPEIPKIEFKDRVITELATSDSVTGSNPKGPKKLFNFAKLNLKHLDHKSQLVFKHALLENGENPVVSAENRGPEVVCLLCPRRAGRPETSRRAGKPPRAPGSSWRLGDGQ